ncbi:MAG TPA: zinc ribbon domain-containing protein [Verrucomicrobiae bacterium]|nr:zinc ribbon domain-containing protein [Verrucomicrobiae bacterium]
MFCPHCGIKIQLENANFCSICGFDLSAAPKGDLSKPVPIVHPPSDDQLSPAPTTQPGLSIASTPPATDLKVKQPKKWGWGWYIAAGIFWVGSSNSYKDYGLFCGTEFVNSLQLLGLALLVPLYFWLRNKLLMRKITNQGVRSFVSGLIAWFVAGFLVAAIADIKIRTDAKQLNQDTRSILIRLAPQLEQFKKQDTDLWAAYTPEPTNRNQIQTNISIVNESLSANEAKYVDVANSLHTMSSLVEKKLKECPAIEKQSNGQYSKFAGQLETIATKADRLGRLNQDLLTNLLKYNQGLMQGDPSASTYLNAAQLTRAEVGSADHEYQSLFEEIWGPPPK